MIYKLAGKQFANDEAKARFEAAFKSANRLLNKAGYAIIGASVIGEAAAKRTKAAATAVTAEMAATAATAASFVAFDFVDGDARGLEFAFNLFRAVEAESTEARSKTKAAKAKAEITDRDDLWRADADRGLRDAFGGSEYRRETAEALNDDRIREVKRRENGRLRSVFRFLAAEFNRTGKIRNELQILCANCSTSKAIRGGTCCHHPRRSLRVIRRIRSDVAFSRVWAAVLAKKFDAVNKPT